MNVSQPRPLLDASDATMASPVAAVAHLVPITLADLDAAAALQERVDRKYLLTGEQLSGLIDGLADRLAVLEIDGRRSAAYESVYFDTQRLDSYRGAAYKRRRRFKVRTRTYLDTETTMLEVKTKGARGQTLKHRCNHEFERRTVLGDSGRRFVGEFGELTGLSQQLLATLTTQYRRTTLADLDDVARLTIDAGLRCTDWADRSVTLDDRFVVETKSAGAPSVADRWLWSVGCRPETISKFGTGLAAIHPGLPSNKWHRTLVRHF
ncbi:MAG: VTC domain-containing protein [Ilumatobacter sp.]